jgi:hypothetical protein
VGCSDTLPISIRKFRKQQNGFCVIAMYVQNGRTGSLRPDSGKQCECCIPTKGIYVGQSSSMACHFMLVLSQTITCLIHWRIRQAVKEGKRNIAPANHSVMVSGRLTGVSRGKLLRDEWEQSIDRPRCQQIV